MDRFVGKEVFFKIGDNEYKLRSPPAKCIPKLLALQGKKAEEFGEPEWDKVIYVITEAVKRTYPDWTQEETDDFVTQNLPLLQEKVILAMGWLSEEDMEKSKTNPNSQ